MGQECLSVSSWARGIVAGIGKGLIGMIAKPIGGAAELVSMTSIGFMNGVGLIELYQQRDYNNCPNEFQMALFNQVMLTKFEVFYCFYFPISILFEFSNHEFLILN